jgi:RNA polymerase sigma-70 factor (ECF subfamily)
MNAAIDLAHVWRCKEDEAGVPTTGRPGSTGVSQRASHGAPLADAELLAAVKAGQSWAADVLIARHLRVMNRLAFRLCRPADVEDVVQESVFLALRALPKLRHADGLATWFASIVVNAARKIDRRRRLLARVGFIDASPREWDTLVSPAAPPDVVAELRATSRALERLPGREREALVLRRVERRPLDEVAAIMGASLASVKRWIAAGERALAEELGGGRP